MNNLLSRTPSSKIIGEPYISLLNRNLPKDLLNVCVGGGSTFKILIKNDENENLGGA